MTMLNHSRKTSHLSEQINELSAIYDDYLFMVRQYEQMLQSSSVASIAAFQMEQLGLVDNPDFPWEIKIMSHYERKQFQDFLEQKIHHDTGRAYVTLQYTNAEEDKTAALSYVPTPYRLYTMDMPLPSTIERYILVFPDKATIGDTDFLINDSYKAVYRRKSDRDTQISEAMENMKTQSEFRILVTLIDSCRKNAENINNRFPGLVLNSYASEAVSQFENTILEILGSFAEKTRDVCFKIYPDKKSKDVLERAERDGLIYSASNIQDYINIRHLMRHQWDTMDELGFFNSQAINKNHEQRMKYLASYRRLCDKTMVQRMKSYVDVLHQMQHTMRQIAPQYLIREPSESNSKFSKRIKEYHAQHPENDVIVEINDTIGSEKHKVLCRSLRKILPQIKINDDFTVNRERFADLEGDYRRRSLFLQTYHSLECRMMTYCMTRGLEANSKETWKYFNDHGLLTPQEAVEWHKYTHLRNTLSHNYYHPALRKQLKDIGFDYFQHLNTLGSKLYNIGADVKWLKYDLFEYTHPDGLRVVMNYQTKQIQKSIKPSNTPQLKPHGKIELPLDVRKARQKSRLETTQPTERYPNGAEVKLFNNNIIELKLPSGVDINFEKQRISWLDEVQFHTNAEHFNVLQTNKYKLFTDKEMRVTEFLEKSRPQPVYGGDTCLLEYKHRVYIDTAGRLKEFGFKAGNGKIIKSTFRQKQNETLITFNDGTDIVLRAKNIVVSHNGKTLTYDTRQEFVASYDNFPEIAPQITSTGHTR